MAHINNRVMLYRSKNIDLKTNLNHSSFDTSFMHFLSLSLSLNLHQSLYYINQSKI